MKVHALNCVYKLYVLRINRTLHKGNNRSVSGTPSNKKKQSWGQAQNYFLEREF